jgi:nitrite reductase/ring-hydroxylating ferredoxin subunit
MSPHANVFTRLFCRSMTALPADTGCLRREGDAALVDLARAPELGPPGGALRLEDPVLPDRLLLVHGHDGEYRCFANHCACSGFRVDPVPGQDAIQCCTLGGSRYDAAGERTAGPAKHALVRYPVTVTGDALRVDLAAASPPKPRK